MGEIVLTGSVFMISLALAVAYWRRVHGRPLSWRAHDPRARRYGTAFLLVQFSNSIFRLVRDILALRTH